MLTARQFWPFSIRKPTLSTIAVGWLAMGVAIVGGSTFNGFAKVLTGALSPISLIFVSEVLTLTFVLLSFGTLPTLRLLVSVPHEKRLPLFIVGMCSGLLGPLLWFWGLSNTEAVNAAFFGKADILILIILSHFMLNERFARGQVLGAVTIAIGVLTIVLQGFTANLSFQFGDILVLIATASYATGSIVFRRYLPGVAPEVAMLVRSVTGITAFFLISPFLTHPIIEEVINFPLALIPALLGFGFLARFLNTFSYYEAIERIPLSSASLVDTSEIILGALFAYLYVGEPLAWYHFMGGALIILGTVMFEILGKGEPESGITATISVHQHRRVHKP